MATYIALMNWTDQGIRNVRESPKRLDAARKMLEEMGGSFRAFYLTMGEYDMVAVLEAPDDAVVARFALQTGMAGNVSHPHFEGLSRKRPTGRLPGYSDRAEGGEPSRAARPFAFYRCAAARARPTACHRAGRLNLPWAQATSCR